MIDIPGSNVSAVKALEKKLGVSSNNVANSQTEGFKKARADIKEGPDGNVEVEIRREKKSGPAAEKEENRELAPKGQSNVDSDEEVTRIFLIQGSYDANLKAVKNKDNMLGTIIDIVG